MASHVVVIGSGLGGLAGAEPRMERPGANPKLLQGGHLILH